MKLTDSELQIMELFWNTGKALSSPDILKLSPAEKLWKDNSVYIMIQTLQKKNAIKEIGAAKGEKGKYLRLFEPTFSREEYYSNQFSIAVDAGNILQLFSALIKNLDLNEETIQQLEDLLKQKRADQKLKG